ncbi:MAG: tetratricopeptide repeat protein [Candidatus Nitronauta litoralis]|uniref:Tetratricopeptide repeat protein n=1 Tax=Candidatus Nitronauta litoralis TaxID=2705533 RepID=A0A7T0BSZ3_9BACT|nr:MAG: tetratricopeptide repeat protein [Candidatus Nitronauta litoralis]
MKRLIYILSLLFVLACVSPGHADEALDWYLKGNTLSREGNYDAAVDAYLKAIRINPDATGPFYNMGIAYKRLGQFPQAAGAFEAAHRLEPDNLNIRFSLGNIYNLMERWEEAIGHLNYVVHRDPENAEAHGNLGWAFLNFDKGPPFKMLVIANLEKAVSLFEAQGLKQPALATQETLEQARKKFGYKKE